LPSPEIDIGGRAVVQALGITLVIVVLDERADLGFEVPGQIVVLQQDPVLQGLVPSLDLALGLGMIRRTADLLHAPIIELFCRAGKVASIGGRTTFAVSHSGH